MNLAEVKQKIKDHWKTWGMIDESEPQVLIPVETVLNWIEEFEAEIRKEIHGENCPCVVCYVLKKILGEK